MLKKSKVRLFVDDDIVINNELALVEEQAHYLCNVLRLKVGDNLLCFNGRDGEFLCNLTELSKKKALIKPIEKTKEFYQSPDLWLLFAPVKKDKTDYIIEKATELGIRKIMPTITIRTITEKVRTERFRAQAVEASEQSRRLDVPIIDEPLSLEKILSNWDNDRVLYFMDETGLGGSILEVFGKAEKFAPASILVGPEGGFDEKELQLLRKCAFAKGVSMGKRILRAETAVAAAIACWQATLGDWS